MQKIIERKHKKNTKINDVDRFEIICTYAHEDNGPESN